MIDKLNINFLKSNYHKYKKIGTAISISLVYRIFVIAINFLTGILISRELMPANRGIFQLFFTSLMVFNILLNFGFNGSIAYFAHKSHEKMKSYIQANFILSLISSVFIVIVISVFSQFFPFQSDFLKWLFIFSYSAFSFKLLLSCALLGNNQTLYSLKLEFFTRSLYFIFILFMYFAGSLNLNSILTFITFEFFLFSFIAYRKLNINIFPFQVNLEFIKETFYINSKSFIASILVTLLLRSDQYLIKFIGGGNLNVGLYSAGSQIIENMCMVTAMISSFYLPKMLQSNDLNFILTKSKKILLIMAASSLAMMLVIYFLSSYIIHLYFKSFNDTATTSLQVLLIGFLFWSLFILIHTIYLSIRYKKSLLIILTFCLVLNISSNFFLIPKFGIIAAAWSSSICYTVLFVLTYIDLFILKRNNFLKKVNEQ